MPEADRAAIREEFVVSGQYDRQSQRIVTRRGAGLRIHQEEAFHAMVDKLRSSDPAAHKQLMGGHANEDAAFHAARQKAAPLPPRAAPVKEAAIIAPEELPFGVEKRTELEGPGSSSGSAKEERAALGVEPQSEGEPEKKGEPAKPPPEEATTKVAPNVTRSVAVLAASKVLRTADPELFDAPPAGNEVPLRVTGKEMQAALDQVAKDWSLDPQAMEKYRKPAEQLARKLLSEARRQGSFDAALAHVESSPTAKEKRSSIQESIRGATRSADPEKVILSAKDAVRQAMRLREAGRSEGLREAVRLRRQVIEEAAKYLPPEERGKLLQDIAGIGNEARAHEVMQRAYDLFTRLEKSRAISDVRDLIRGADTKRMFPEFRKAMEAITGDLQDAKPSEKTRRRAEGLLAHMQTMSPEERAALAPRTLEMVERLSKQSLDSFSTEELHDMADAIRSIVRQNQLKGGLLQGKHIRDLRKVEGEAISQVKRYHEPLGLEGKPGEAVKLKEKSLVGKGVTYTSSPEVLVVDAGGEGGELHDALYNELIEAEDRQIDLERHYVGLMLEAQDAAGIDQSKMIEWGKKTRMVQLSELPKRTGRRGGLDELLQAESAAAGDETAQDNAARAAGESIQRGTGPAAVEAARAARDATREINPAVPESERTAVPEPAEPRSIELTGPEIVSLWALAQNSGSYNMLVENGVIPKRLRGQSAFNRTLTPADIDAITATMTPFEKKMGELALRMGNELGPQMSEQFLRLYGYELPLVENYFKREPDRLQRNLPVDEIAQVFSPKWVEQLGMLKDRVEGHRIPIMIPDALETMLDSLEKSSSFIAKVVPVRNARALLGSRMLRETLDSHVGRDFVPKMERLLKDFSGVDITPRTGYEKLTAALARNVAVGTLGLRPTTVLTNFIGPSVELMSQMEGPLAKAFARKFINLKANTVDAQKYFEEHIAPNNPYLAARFDTHAEFHRQAVAAAGEGGAAAGSGLPTAKTAAGQKWRNFQEWTMSWINKGERAGVVAAHRAIAEMNPEWSDAQVSKRLEKMVRRTQNAVSTMDMSEALRDAKANPAVGLALLFTNQAGKLRDTAHLAILKYLRSDRSGSAKAELAARLGLVATSAAIVPMAVRWLWGQVRSGAREDEAKGDKSVLDYGGSVVADLGDVVHPWFGDTIRLMEGKGFGDTVSNRAISQLAQGFTRLEAARSSKDPAATAYAIVANLTRGIGTLTGVPVDAPLSAAEGLGKAVAGRPAEFHLQQEALRLRARGGARGLSLHPAERVRLRRLEGILGRVAQIRKRQKDGKIEKSRAERLVAQLVAAS